MMVINEVGIREILDYKENDGSSSDDDSVEPSGEESSDESSLDGKGGVNEEYIF